MTKDIIITYVQLRNISFYQASKFVTSGILQAPEVGFGVLVPEATRDKQLEEIILLFSVLSNNSSRIFSFLF